MRRTGSQAALSYPLRLPDAAQAAALRLLDVSKRVINSALAALWPRLDDFGERSEGPAWKQVEGMLASPEPHGSRQWRCEAEQVGRLLRAQAHRKRLFGQVLPLLAEGLIRPQTDQRRAGKNRPAIRQALADLQAAAESDGGSLVELQSLMEQACNHWLRTGGFPATYKEMQSLPVLKVGVLPYAGDDGPLKGQTYRLALDLAERQITMAMRCPDAKGQWSRTWTGNRVTFRLPEPVTARLLAGEALAPTLRAVEEPGGSRYAVLDLIVEVPVQPAPVWEEMERVLGFDWGVRSASSTFTIQLPEATAVLSVRSHPVPTGCVAASEAS